MRSVPVPCCRCHCPPALSRSLASGFFRSSLFPHSGRKPNRRSAGKTDSQSHRPSRQYSLFRGLPAMVFPVRQTSLLFCKPSDQTPLHVRLSPRTCLLSVQMKPSLRTLHHPGSEMGSHKCRMTAAQHLYPFSVFSRLFHFSVKLQHIDIHLCLQTDFYLQP